MKLTRSRVSRPWVYFALTYIWSGLFWCGAILSGDPISSSLTMVLYALGGLGPLVSGIFLTYLTGDRKVRRDFWRRAVDFTRIGTGWYVVIVFLPLLVRLVVAGIERLSTGQVSVLVLADRWKVALPTILTQGLGLLIVGPVPEELGWRGYALDRLLARYNALVSSLILGAGWALWHLPLFFIAGTYQQGLGIGTLAFGLFMAEILLWTPVMTWIYNNTRRSTLSAILFHFAANLVGELFEVSQQAQVYRLAVWAFVVVMILLVWGPARFKREKAPVVNLVSR